MGDATVELCSAGGGVGREGAQQGVGSGGAGVGGVWAADQTVVPEGDHRSCRANPIV